MKPIQLEWFDKTEIGIKNFDDFKDKFQIFADFLKTWLSYKSRPEAQPETRINLTVFSQLDLKSKDFDAGSIKKLNEDLKQFCLQPEQLVPLGIGSTDLGQETTVFYIIIVCQELDQLREKYKLEPKLYHVTIGYSGPVLEKEMMDMDLNLMPEQPPDIVNIMRAEKLLDYAKILINKNRIHWALMILKIIEKKITLKHEAECLDLIAHCHLQSKNLDECFEYCEKIIRIKGTTRSFCRLADCLFVKKHYRLAALAYLESWCRDPEQQLEKYVRKRLESCVAKVGFIWSNLTAENDMATFTQVESLIPFREMRQVRQIFPLIKNWRVSTEVSLDSGNRLLLRPNLYKMPRFFSWIVHGLLAGMSTPRNADDLKALEELGFAHVVTLTEEEPLKADWFNGLSIENHFLPVTNGKAPDSSNAVDYFIQLVLSSAAQSHQQESISDAVLVHCGGGKGRAGTFLACYLLRFGLEYPRPLCKACFYKAKQRQQVIMVCEKSSCAFSVQPVMSAQEAIEILRILRPGSIETVEQERFVRMYSELIWKRFHQETLPEPSLPLEIQGRFPTKPQLVVCCGLPGSGKSWFSSRLEESGFVRICQDDLESKSTCESVASSAFRNCRPVVIDKCNPKLADREMWLKLLLYPSTAVCIHFNADASLCEQRAQSRLLHPTLTTSGRITNAIKHFETQFQVPVPSEKFAAICTVPSFPATLELLKTKFGVSVETGTGNENDDDEADDGLAEYFKKFPRTQHLMNLGAVTRDDLLLADTDRKTFFQPSTDYVLTLEEKVDGANIGISIDENYKFMVQNRSHYVNSKSHIQFKSLDKWLMDHTEDLMQILLGDGEGVARRFILFGEWLSATHSIPYSELPDRFLAFDIYDAKHERFLSRHRFDEVLRGTAIQKVPRIIDYTLPLSEDAVKKLIYSTSKFYNGPMEGIYFRLDSGDHLAHRAKVVRTDFIAGNEFWDKGMIRWNGITNF